MDVKLAAMEAGQFGNGLRRAVRAGGRHDRGAVRLADRVVAAVRTTTQGLVLAFLGAVLVRLSWEGAYLHFVTGWMRWPLLVTGVVLVLLAVRPIVGGGEREEHPVPAATWLLLLPALVVFLVSPQPLGAYLAERRADEAPPVSPVASFAPLPDAAGRRTAGGRGAALASAGRGRDPRRPQRRGRGVRQPRRGRPVVRDPDGHRVLRRGRGRGPGARRGRRPARAEQLGRRHRRLARRDRSRAGQRGDPRRGVGTTDPDARRHLQLSLGQHVGRGSRPGTSGRPGPQVLEPLGTQRRADPVHDPLVLGDVAEKWRRAPRTRRASSAAPTRTARALQSGRARAPGPASCEMVQTAIRRWPSDQQMRGTSSGRRRRTRRSRYGGRPDS